MPLKQNQLLPAELTNQTAEFSRRAWQWTIPSRWKWDDLLNPEVYKLVGEHLKPGDLITVIGQLGDFDCDLRVVAADRGYCLVRPVRTWFSNAVAAPSDEPASARIQFIPGKGFVVMSEANEPVSAHFVEDDAKAALSAYLAKQVPNAA